MKSAKSFFSLSLVFLSCTLATAAFAEILWSDNFSDGNYGANPAWNIPWGEVSIAPFGGSQVMDCHAEPMGFSGRIYVGLPDLGFGGTDVFSLEFDVHPRESLTSANNVRVQIWNWETYDCFELMENDNDNLQLRANGTTVAQVVLNGFPDRWHHVLMARASSGLWTVIWDLGGSNQTIIQGQDPWGGQTSTLLPVLQIQCDGNYNAVNGAYFDHLEMWSGGLLVWQDDFEDGNYTADPAWNIPWGLVSVPQFAGDYVLDCHASPDAPGFSGRIYVSLPDIGYGGLDAFKLECDVYPRKTLSSANNVRIQFWNWETYDYFELMENDNDNLQLRSNGQILAQEPLNGFPNRWHHIVMQTDSTGYWTVIWDQGGSNQTTLAAQGPWGTVQNTLVPVLQIQCDGYYSTVNGAYFDNFVMSTLEGSYPGEFVVDDHTAALWHFNENSGLVAHDATANNYDMTLQDGAGWHSPGWNNTPSAVDLTDPDAKVNSNYTVGNGWDAITLEAWIYPTQIGPFTGWFCDHPIITRQEFHNVSDCSYFLILTAKGEIYAGVNLNEPGGPVSQALTDSGMVQVNNWYHVAATWSSGEPLRIFINDMTTPVEVSSDPVVPGIIRNGTDALRIGCNWTVEYYNEWEYFQGYIDEARISDIDRYPELSSGSVEIALTPINPPILIPQNGGSFSFNTTIQNQSGASQIFDVWCAVQVPGGSQFTSFGPLTLNLESGSIIARLRTQAVPASAPGGEYSYWGFVGDYPWNMMDSDQFPFVKEGGSGDALGSDGWIYGGEPFPGERASEDQTIPEEFAVIGVTPNPFNPLTTISFALPEAARVELTICDIGGRAVSRVLNTWRYAGVHEVAFDGSGLASGVYIYHLKANVFSVSGKLVLLK